MESPQRKRGQHHRYERLGRSGSRHKNQGGCSSSFSDDSGKPRRKHSWRIRITPRLRVFRHTKKMLVQLREAYAKMVVRLARGGGRRVTGTGRPALKGYDEKVMAQIYRCVMVQGQMTGGVGSVVGY